MKLKYIICITSITVLSIAACLFNRYSKIHKNISKFNKQIRIFSSSIINNTQNDVNFTFSIEIYPETHPIYDINCPKILTDNPLMITDIIPILKDYTDIDEIKLLVENNTELIFSYEKEYNKNNLISYDSICVCNRFDTLIEIQNQHNKMGTFLYIFVVVPDKIVIPKSRSSTKSARKI